MNTQMITQLYELIIFPLLFVLAGFLIQFIKTKTAELKANASNETQ